MEPGSGGGKSSRGASGGPRPELVARLDTLADRGMALVRAPAGSGKTTLLAAWARGLESRSWAAVHQELGPAHEDFSFWIQDLVDLLEDRLKGFGEQVRRRLQQIPDAEAAWPLVLRSLVRDWPRRGSRTVLMVDGLERLPADGAALRLLSALVLRPPAGVASVLATRGRVPEAVARLRLEGRLLEVGPDDLRLRSLEVAAVLVAEGVEPDPEHVARVLAATEGWAAGVRLLARHLAAVPPARRDDRFRELARHEDLVGYLSLELLEGQPAEVLRLLETAARVGPLRPEELSLLLGDSIDFRATLRAAVDAGLLVRRAEDLGVPEIWRGVLIARTDAVAGHRPRAAPAAEVARRLARRGRVEEALRLLLAVNAPGAAADLLAARGPELASRGRASRVLALLEELPGELREERPDLLQLEATVLAGRNPDRAEARLRRALDLSRQQHSEEGGRRALAALLFLYASTGRLHDARRLIREGFRPRTLVRDPAARGGLLVWLAVRALLAGRYRRALGLAERASRQGLGAVERWAAATVRATVHHLDGEFGRADEVLRPALEDRELIATGVLYQALRLQSAMTAAARGDPARACAEVEEAVETLAALSAHQLEPAAWMARGRVYAAAGALSEALRSFERAVALARAHGNRGAEAQALAELSLARHREADPVGAHEAARAAVEAYQRCFAGGDELFPWWQRYAAWVLGASGEPEEAMALLRAHARRSMPRDLPLVQHVALLLEADLARLAGRLGEARELARRGWSLALDVGTRVADLAILREVAVPTVVLAAEAGTDVRQLLPRLAALGAEKPAAAAEALVAHSRAAVRLAGVWLAARSLAPPTLRARLVEVARSDRSRAVRAAAEEVARSWGAGREEGIVLRTLGGFALERTEGPKRAARATATPLRLLARLLVAGPRGLSRERLAEDLWPDAEPAVARNRLRVAISRLSDLLEPGRVAGARRRHLVTSGDRLELVRGESLIWDAALFESAFERFRRGLAEGDEAAARRHGLAAADLFRGGLLPELPDEPWLLPTRRHLGDRFEELATRLGPLLVEAGDLTRAEALAERAREMDPGSEPACRLLVAVRLARDDRAAARRAIEEHEHHLRSELGVEPDPALRALLEAGRPGRDAGPASGSTSG